MLTDDLHSKSQDNNSLKSKIPETVCTLAVYVWTQHFDQLKGLLQIELGKSELSTFSL